MADNSFLKNFLKMRHELERPKEEAPTKKGSAIPLPAQEEGISLATIVEDMPVKSVVLKYLRQRIEFLTKDD